MIGKLSSSLDRGFVFSLIPTPPNDEGRPACSLVEPVKDDKRKGGKQSKSQGSSDSSSLVIDKDWVAEHARQVVLSHNLMVFMCIGRQYSFSLGVVGKLLEVHRLGSILTYYCMHFLMMQWSGPIR